MAAEAARLDDLHRALDEFEREFRGWLRASYLRPHRYARRPALGFVVSAFVEHGLGPMVDGLRDDLDRMSIELSEEEATRVL